MSERPTPITDADDYDAGLLGDYGGGDVGWWQDYLRSEIGRANDHWRLRHDDIARELAEAREEIAELETRHAATMLHTQAIVDDANSLRDKRDRLAEAAEQMMTYRPNGLSECQHEVGVWNDLAEALAAVKEVQQ